MILTLVIIQGKIVEPANKYLTIQRRCFERRPADVKFATAHWAYLTTVTVCVLHP